MDRIKDVDGLKLKEHEVFCEVFMYDQTPSGITLPQGSELSPDGNGVTVWHVNR